MQVVDLAHDHQEVALVAVEDARDVPPDLVLQILVQRVGGEPSLGLGPSRENPEVLREEFQVDELADIVKQRRDVQVLGVERLL